MKSIIRPVLMLLFVLGMIYLMQLKIEEDQALRIQETEIDPASVIYSDVGLYEEEVIDIEIPEENKPVDSSESGEVK